MRICENQTIRIHPIPVSNGMFGLTFCPGKRGERLLHQVRYDRAVLYEQVGRKAQARREFERLYAEDPGFEDVRARLNS